MIRVFGFLVATLWCSGAWAQGYIRIPTCNIAAPAAGVSPGYMDANGNICFSAGDIAGTVTTTPAATTYQGTMVLAAATSTQLIAANVTMTFGTLPAAGAFKNLTIIAPQGCAFTVNWGGSGAATATSGESMGSGTNVGSDTVNLASNANAPTLFSAAGCPSPNLISFHGNN